MKYSDEDISKRLSLETLEPEMAARMLASFHETLSTRVMMAVFGSLSDEQLKQFEAADDAGKNALLEQAVPDYEQLVDTEADNLFKEIDDNAARMVEGA